VAGSGWRGATREEEEKEEEKTVRKKRKKEKVRTRALKWGCSPMAAVCEDDWTADGSVSPLSPLTVEKEEEEEVEVEVRATGADSGESSLGRLVSVV